MKKLVLLTLALLCLCLCTSCSDIVYESSSYSVSFTPGVSKYLSSTNNYFGDDLIKAENYYWEYASLPYTIEMDDIVEEIRNARFTTFFQTDTDNTYFNTSTNKYNTSRKGLGEVSGFSKGSKYVFGLRGYSDPEMTDLIWEGFTLSPQRLDKKKNTVVMFMTFVAQGKGHLYFDISVPGNEQDINQVKFVYTYIKEDISINVKDPVEDTTIAYFTPSFSSPVTQELTNLSCTDITPNNLSDTDCKFRYISSSAELDLSPGIYFFSFKEMVLDNDGTWIDFPGAENEDKKTTKGLLNNVSRTQVVIVHILPDTDTYIVGDLNEFVQTQVSPSQLQVSFHTSDISSIANLVLTTSTTTYSDRQYTVISADKNDHIEWMINGSYRSDTDCMLQFFTEQPSEESNTYLLDTDPNDGVILFYRADGDNSLYMLTCLYYKEDESAMSLSIDLEAEQQV